MSTPTVAASLDWDYALSMPSTRVAARVETKVWTDGVVLATVFGDDERDAFSASTWRGVIRRNPKWAVGPAWSLLDDDGRLIVNGRTRRDLLATAGAFAINGWAAPIRVRIAASERAARAAQPR